MDIKSKPSENQAELQEFLVYQFINRDSITAIVEYETLKDIIDELEEYASESVNRYKCHIVEDEDDLYVITKEKYSDDFTIMEVSSLFIGDEDEECDIKYIVSDIVYIEDMNYNISEGLMEELEESICSDNIYNLFIDDELEYEDEDYNDKEEANCSECLNHECEYNCNNKEEIDDDDPVVMIIEEYAEKISNTKGCPDCIREILFDMYMQVYKEALTNELLLQHDIVNDRLFGEEGLLN